MEMQVEDIESSDEMDIYHLTDVDEPRGRFVGAVFKILDENVLNKYQKSQTRSKRCATATTIIDSRPESQKSSSIEKQTIVESERTSGKSRRKSFEDKHKSAKITGTASLDERKFAKPGRPKWLEEMKAKRRIAIAESCTPPKTPSPDKFGRRNAMKPGMAEIAQLVHFRLRYAKAQNLKLEDELYNEDDMPEEPRFCATLSDEAQYAMLRCYQDKLYYQLNEKHMLRNSCKSIRCETPMGKVMAVLQGANENSNDTAPCLVNNVDSRSCDEDDRSREKKLKITCTFEQAMDMIDNMKISDGDEETLSPRRRKSKVNPSKSFRRWSNSWQENFKFTKIVQTGHT